MTASTLLVAAHASAALVCLGLGSHVLLRRVKGDRAHRSAGWCWAAGMVFVATSSFAIRDLRDGRLSLLHVLSIVTLISLGLGIRSARRHDVVRHRSRMRGSYLGLVGAFTGAVAVPARTLPTFVVTEPRGAAAAALATAMTTAGVIAVAHVASRRGAASPAGPARPRAPRERQGVRGGSR